MSPRPMRREAPRSEMAPSARMPVADGPKAVNIQGQLRWSTDVINQMRDEVNDLKERVAELEAQVEALSSAAGKLVMIRTIDRAEAKREIHNLFESGETLYYSDFVQRLGLDISVVVELCKELESEGEVVTLGHVP